MPSCYSRGWEAVVNPRLPMNTKRTDILLCHGCKCDHRTRPDSPPPQRVHLCHCSPITDDDQAQLGARPHDVQPPRIVHKPNLARHVAPHGGEHDDVALPPLEGVDRRTGDRRWQGAFQEGDLFRVGRECGDDEFGL